MFITNELDAHKQSKKKNKMFDNVVQFFIYKQIKQDNSTIISIENLLVMHIPRSSPLFHNTYIYDQNEKMYII